jgi:hypothetical protein
LVEDAEVYLEE